MLIPLDQAQTYARWDWLKAGLEQCIAKTGMHLKPEDAYIRIRGGSAFPFVMNYGDKDCGFVIITQEFDPDGPVMFIWAMWTEIGTMQYVKEITADLDQLQIATKAVRQRMWGRPGWERVWGKKITTVFEREASNA